MNRINIEVENLKGKTFKKVTIRHKLNYLSTWLSYDTVIAFAIFNQSRFSNIIARENNFSQTTGRHLNMISKKEARISHEEFQKQYQEAIYNFMQNVVN